MVNDPVRNQRLGLSEGKRHPDVSRFPEAHPTGRVPSASAGNLLGNIVLLDAVTAEVGA